MLKLRLGSRGSSLSAILIGGTQRGYPRGRDQLESTGNDWRQLETTLPNIVTLALVTYDWVLTEC